MEITPLFMAKITLKSFNLFVVRKSKIQYQRKSCFVYISSVPKPIQVNQPADDYTTFCYVYVTHDLILFFSFEDIPQILIL